MLADDHELWDGYPKSSFLSLWSWSEENRLTADRAAKSLFRAYQGALNPGSIDDLGRSVRLAVPPVSIFVIDSWLFKPVDVNETFVAPRELDSLKKWLQALDGPGVIVVSSPIAVIDPGQSSLEALAKQKWDPPSAFPDDMVVLWTAMAQCPHDIVVIAGDVHYGRFGVVDVGPWRARLGGKGPRKGRVYEIISSPLAGLKNPPIMQMLPMLTENQYRVNPSLRDPARRTALLDLRNAPDSLPRLRYRSILTDEITPDSLAYGGMYATVDFRQQVAETQMRVRYYPNARDADGVLRARYQSTWITLQ
jgi:hypothetical protein